MSAPIKEIEAISNACKFFVSKLTDFDKLLQKTELVNTFCLTHLRSDECSICAYFIRAV